MNILGLAEDMWLDAPPLEQFNAFSLNTELAEISPGCAFVASFGNVTIFSTEDGLVTIDSGSPMLAPTVFDAIRQWSSERLNTTIFSHGHIDHVFGVHLFDSEAEQNRWPRPRVVAHQDVAHRFDRYLLTAGYNAAINRRQFQARSLKWPTNYRYPDETYHDSMTLQVGGRTFELHHARGETDDHTWTWLPESKILCTGDLFIWTMPNAGNPQKAQRYPREWAQALREMAALKAEILLPGHGLPIIGSERVHRALSETAELLESLVEQTLSMMNSGAPLDEIARNIEVPEHLRSRPYLQPTYDETEFIVRNIWRLYGGWYDGNPSRLKPASDTEIAREIAWLAGGPHALADRALKLAENRDFRLASHLIELAATCAPSEKAIHSIRAEIFEKRALEETSTMAKGIYLSAALESRVMGKNDG